MCVLYDYIKKSLKIFRPKAANFNVKFSITARFGYFITQPQTIAIETVRKEQLIKDVFNLKLPENNLPRHCSSGSNMP